MRLHAHGFAVDLPQRWEGAVRLGEVGDQLRARAARAGREVHTPPVLHLTTASLPQVRGDFGSGAVDLLGTDDVFVAVVEYGPDSVGTALFDTGPMPRRLSPADFTPNGLQRAIPGQAGAQVFCTEQGRALCLYAVIGDHRRASRLSARVGEVLDRIEVVAR